MHLLLLNEIARIIGAARSLQEVLDRVVSLVADRMQTDVCSIWLLDASRTRLVLAATEGLSHEAIGRATLERGEGLTWQVLERMAPVIIEDAPGDPHYVYLPETREEPFHSFLSLPLQVRGTAIGALSVQTREARRILDDEVHALGAIASQIAPVVDNARLLALIARGEEGAEPPGDEDGPKRAVGTPCSSGVVAGPILRLGTRPPPAAGPVLGVGEELVRLETACVHARSELLKMQEWLRERNAEEAALVFSVQLMMLEDAAVEGRMRQTVQKGLGAHAAIESVTTDALARFESLRDLFYRERAADVRDLARRLKRHVAARREDGGGEILRGKIAVLPLLAPSRMVSLCAEGVAGVLAGGGGATSHAALLARSLDLPLVVGLGDFVTRARDGQRALVDAATGEVVLDPPDQLVAEATRAATAGAEAFRRLAAPLEGARPRLRYEANVSLWGDAVRARRHDADGIGLYRTEFAFLMRPDLPGEDEQYALYRRVVEEVAPRPVTFRLLDAGGDKLVPALGQIPEPNPFLGYRSLRLLLDHPDVLSAQVRAILHALEGTEGRLLVPMVGSSEDFAAVRERIDGEGLPTPAVGAMIEVPSALHEMDDLAGDADFLCVGTNDLTQHLLAVDRTNARVTRFFDLCYPAVIRALHAVAQAARRTQKPLSICGEAASDPIFLPLWLALGAERLSVHAPLAGVLRSLETRVDDAAIEPLMPDLLKMTKRADIRKRLESLVPPEVLGYLSARATAATPRGAR